MYFVNVKCFRATLAFSQKGAGLVEMMVSMLVLGVGLLGVLSLQANGVSSNQRAIFLTEAQVLAQDMADRIRSFGSDGLGARDDTYNNLYNSTDTGTRGGAQAYSKKTCSTACDADATVALDQYEWEAALDETSLPGGIGKIIVRDNSLNQYIVRVFWDQDRTGANTQIADTEDCFNNTKQKDKQNYLTCYDAVVSLYRD